MAEILVIANVINQDTIVTNPISGLIAAITAIVVATPLPPLNFKYIGKICAKTAKSCN